jgi:hypothetical protein
LGLFIVTSEGVEGKMESVRMEKVRSYVKSACLRKKWQAILEKVEKRILMLPEQMQEDLLQDISEAIEKRVAVMERAKRE